MASRVLTVDGPTGLGWAGNRFVGRVWLIRRYGLTGFGFRVAAGPVGFGMDHRKFGLVCWVRAMAGWFTGLWVSEGLRITLHDLGCTGRWGLGLNHRWDGLLGQGSSRFGFQINGRLAGLLDSPVTAGHGFRVWPENHGPPRSGSSSC
jgi:hypothetical protein